MALIEQLSEIELFSELPKRELKRIEALMNTVKVKVGRNIAVQGQPGREFMFVVDGEASVRRNGRVVARLWPGDFYGELSLVAGVPRSATVTADTEMELQVLSRRDVSTMLDESPMLARKILVGAAKRLHELEESIVK